MTDIPYIQDDKFDTLINNGSLVVVDFTASWCGPCRKISPYMEQLATDYSGQVTVVKMDIDQETPKKFAVRRIPAVLFFKDGEHLETLVGVSPYETFADAVAKHLAPQSA